MTKPTKENSPTPSNLADALESADWSGVSIGNKILLKAAIAHLRRAANMPSEEELDDIIFVHVDVDVRAENPRTTSVSTREAAKAVLKRIRSVK